MKLWSMSLGYHPPLLRWRFMHFSSSLQVADAGIVSQCGAARQCRRLYPVAGRFGTMLAKRRDARAIGGPKSQAVEEPADHRRRIPVDEPGENV